MSRTNLSVLIATALLGVLLFVVRQMFPDGGPPARLPEPATVPDARPALPPAERPEPVADRSPPSAADARGMLEARGLAADTLLRATRDWYDARGLTGAVPALGLPPSPVGDYLDSLDAATLAVASEGGDALATLELASRTAVEDPFRALDLYELAAAQGATAALLRIASLRETLAAVSPNDFASNPEYLRQLQRLGGGASGASLRFSALAHALAAIRDGGPPVVDASTLAWVERLAGRLPPGQIESACRQADGIRLRISEARRAGGVAPVIVTPPPVFATVPGLAERLPCAGTASPARFALSLDDCAVAPLETDGGELELGICAEAS